MSTILLSGQLETYDSISLVMSEFDNISIDFSYVR